MFWCRKSVVLASMLYGIMMLDSDVRYLIIMGMVNLTRKGADEMWYFWYVAKVVEI